MIKECPEPNLQMEFHLPEYFFADGYNANLATATAQQLPELAMFESFMRGHGSVRGDFARLALDVADTGDPAAVDLARRVAQSHARDVLGVARTLGMLDDEADIVMAGSVHKRACAPWVDAFTAAVTQEMPGAQFRVLDVPPVAGCVLLAVESLDVDSEAIAADVRRGAAQLLGSRTAGE